MAAVRIPNCSRGPLMSSLASSRSGPEIAESGVRAPTIMLMGILPGKPGRPRQNSYDNGIPRGVASLGRAGIAGDPARAVPLRHPRPARPGTASVFGGATPETVRNREISESVSVKILVEFLELLVEVLSMARIHGPTFDRHSNVSTTSHFTQNSQPRQIAGTKSLTAGHP